MTGRPRGLEEDQSRVLVTRFTSTPRELSAANCSHARVQGSRPFRFGAESDGHANDDRDDHGGQPPRLTYLAPTRLSGSETGRTNAGL
jgi:hypothetical protein